MCSSRISLMIIFCLAPPVGPPGAAQAGAPPPGAVGVPPGAIALIPPQPPLQPPELPSK